MLCRDITLQEFCQKLGNMVWKMLLFFFFIIDVLAWKPPTLNCDVQKSTENWCQHYTRRGKHFVCEEKSRMMMAVCRNQWCEMCPKQKQAEQERLKLEALWKSAMKDKNWKRNKSLIKPQFVPFGLGYYFDKTLRIDQMLRYEVYLITVDKIDEFKEKHGENMEYEMGLNRFAFVTTKEKSGKAGLKLQNLERSPYLPQIPERDIETEVKNRIRIGDGTDWRPVLGTIIRDQGFCGCSWAQSTSQLLESFYQLESGQNVAFSTQQLIDCSTNGENNGCEGGIPHNALEYTRNNGIITESNYPFSSLKKVTRRNKCSYSIAKVKTFTAQYEYFYNGNSTVNNDWDSSQAEERLMQILDVTPVIAAVASDDIMFYKKGVYNNPDCQGKIDHAVLLVGYGTSNEGTPYWIIKNSWGEKWGENGYMRIKRGNVCGLSQYWTYITKLTLCPKLSFSDCVGHPDCEWYGENCDVKAEKCSEADNKKTCGFLGCYWHEEKEKCLPPTSKCVVDMSLQKNQDSCQLGSYCQWSKYGNCQVKTVVCNAVSSCEIHYCSRKQSHCSPWYGYQCSLMFANEEDCNGNVTCQWYEGKCRQKPFICQLNNGPSDCAEFEDCYWIPGKQVCVSKTQSCLFEQEKSMSQLDCASSSLCSWTDEKRLCNVHPDICEELGTDQSSCEALGCQWNSTSKFCDQKPIQDRGKCSKYENEMQCSMDWECSWWAIACGPSSYSCSSVFDQDPCTNVGCAWSEMDFACLVPVTGCLMEDVSSSECNDQKLCAWHSSQTCNVKQNVCGYNFSPDECEKMACTWNGVACVQVTDSGIPCIVLSDQSTCDAVNSGDCTWDDNSQKCLKQ